MYASASCLFYFLLVMVLIPLLLTLSIPSFSQTHPADPIVNTLRPHWDRPGAQLPSAQMPGLQTARPSATAPFVRLDGGYIGYGAVCLCLSGSTASPGAIVPTVPVAPQKIYMVRVPDVQGFLRKTFSYAQGVGRVSLNLSDLNNGNYTIQVYNKKTWSSSHVLLVK